MKRYFTPGKEKAAASKEALAMFEDKSKRAMVAKRYTSIKWI